MADEPVSAWAEPWTRKLLRWLTRHRTGVTGAAAAVLAGVVGLSAVLAVQTQANAELPVAEREADAANAGCRGQRRAGPTKGRCRPGSSWLRRPSRRSTPASARTSCSRTTEFKELRTKLLKEAAGFYDDLKKLLERADRRRVAEGAGGGVFPARPT